MSGTKAPTVSVERKWSPDSAVSQTYVEKRKWRDDKGAAKSEKSTVGYIIHDHSGRWRAYLWPTELLGDREDAVLAMAMVEAAIMAREKGAKK